MASSSSSSSSTAVSLLALGSGWTSTFLLPLLASKRIPFAYTTRSGQPRDDLAGLGLPPPIAFQLPEDEAADIEPEAFSVLPRARSVLIVFPLKSPQRVDAIVRGYEARHGPTNWIALGSTGAWPDTGHFSSSSPPLTTNPRANAESHLLSYHDAALPRLVTVLNLAGLYGGQRQPRNFAKRVGSEKDKLAQKGSLHLVHGNDVARVIAALVEQLDGDGRSAWGRRWIVTDTHVYDWWHLFTALQPVPDAHRWVKELCDEHGVKALPRQAASLSRSLDGSAIWEALGIRPEVGRCDEVDDDGKPLSSAALPEEILDAEEEHELRRFERSDEFLAALQTFVEEPDDKMLAKLCDMLDEYQSQPFLLDPYLERIVEAPVARLQAAIRADPTADSPDRPRLARLLYFVTKIRGYKMTAHFFPHAVGDLLPTLAALEHLAGDAAASWELRYVLLLWLSLICMIPFDLGRFDAAEETSPTSQRIERLARGFLDSPGKERDASAVLLAKLFQRKDVPGSRFAALLDEASTALHSKTSPFLTTGLLSTVCTVVKASDAASIAPRVPALVALLDIDNPTRNALVERYKAKLACRVGLKLLKPRVTRGKQAVDDDEDDIPEELDHLIAKLLDALQDKDTTVRYSAAKGLSRLCSRLPRSFSDQVAAAVVALFAAHGLQDLGAVSEHTWQGACMALAELARRGLLSAQELQDALPWVQQALLFDVRRGSSSVGSNVRDAACYVLWALARSHDADSVRPYALELAQSLAAVACLDRDVSIRRAASAAFQECCGRLNLFPHGLDVIRVADFYSVSNRSNAFLRCAPQVAALNPYRSHLISHLVTRTIVHWDPAMRELGSKSLAAVARTEAALLVPQIVAKVSPFCSSGDLAVLHGALMTLAELGQLALDAATRRELLSCLASVPRSVLKRLGTTNVLEAACRVVAVAVDQETASSSAWPPFVDAAQSRTDDACHAAAADALAAVSRFADVSQRVDKASSSWASLGEAQRRSAVLALGRIRYRDVQLLATATSLLIDVVTPKSPRYGPTVEIRRNAIEALAEAVTSHPSLDLVSAALKACLVSLDDYTADQRGDVGSWVRLAAVRAVPRLVSCARSIGSLDETTLNASVAGVLKQSVERIDGVRAEAGKRLMEIVAAGTTAIAGGDLIRSVFDGPQTFADAAWLFPRAVQLLVIPAHRKQLLRGIALSLGSKTEMGHRIVAAALIDWLSEQQPDVRFAVLTDLVQLATTHFSSSREFVPLLLTLASVLEAEDDDDEEAELLATLLSLATRNIAAVKSPQRILACMKVLVVLVSRPSLRATAAPHLPSFLGHRMPTIRSATAEALYTLLAEEAPDSLVETPWSSLPHPDAQTEARSLCAQLLSV